MQRHADLANGVRHCRFVASFGLNGNCAGIGGAFRIDRDMELDWINSFPITTTMS